mgnify:CR=1 FL=1|tara:strand:- start:5007 stop:5417 length:411 start_codon:yes stop_codon:yes gene_type:complete
MRITVLFLLLLSCSLSKAQKDSTLFGEWVLTKLEINNTILTPDSGKYKVKITEKKIKYLLEINWCDLDNWKTVQNEIIVDSLVFCTMACCDDRNSDFYKNLNYTGRYHFLNNNSILVIENKNGVFHLKRNTWSNPD